jgi:hypothetical protein
MMPMDLQRQRRARRWVWGCTGGCLGCILLAALAVFLTARYLLEPVPVVPPQTFLTQQTSAFVIARVDPAVPLTVVTAQALAGLLGERGADPVLNREAMEACLSIFPPLQCVLMVQRGASGGATHGGLAVSVKRGSRLLTRLTEAEVARATQPPAQFTAYDGAKMAALAKDFFVALRKNNVMLADSQDVIKAWTDALQAAREREAEEGSGPPPVDLSPAFKAVYDRLDTSLPLLFASLNVHGELESLAGLAGDPEARDLLERSGVLSEDIVSLAGQVRPLDANTGELTLFIECPSAQAANALVIRLAEVQSQAGARWPLKRMSARSNATLVTVNGRVEDLPAKAAYIVNGVIRGVHGKPGEQRAPVKATEGPTIST